MPQGCLQSLFGRGGVASGVDGDVLSFSAGGHELRPFIGVGVAEGTELVDGVAYGGVVAEGNQAH